MVTSLLSFCGKKGALIFPLSISKCSSVIQKCAIRSQESKPMCKHVMSTIKIQLTRDLPDCILPPMGYTSVISWGS